MQNIESILREFGLEIPAEKMAAFQARFRENYKTVKEVSKLEAARDQWKAKAEAADGALQDAQSAFDAAIAQRDFDDALNAALAGYKFTSEAAKRDVAGQVRAAGLTLESGRIQGLEALMEAIREKDGSAFVDETAAVLRLEMARFTRPVSDGGSGAAPMTREKIMAIPDRAARRRAIAENIEIFKGE